MAWLNDQSNKIEEVIINWIWKRKYSGFELLRNIHGNGESKLHDYMLTINKQKKKRFICEIQNYQENQ